MQIKAQVCETADQVRQLNKRVKDMRKLHWQKRPAPIELVKEEPPPAPKYVEPSKPSLPPYLVRRDTPTADDIIAILCEKYFGVTETHLKASRRDMPTVRVRQIACYLMRDMTLLSTPMIGRALGDRDHTTILHGARKTTERMNADPAFNTEINRLKLAIVERMQKRNSCSGAKVEAK